MSITSMTPAADRLAAFINTLTENQLVEAIINVAGVPMMGGIHVDLVLELEARFPGTAAAAWDAIMADESDTLGFADALKQVQA